MKNKPLELMSKEELIFEGYTMGFNFEYCHSKEEIIDTLTGKYDNLE